MFSIKKNGLISMKACLSYESIDFNTVYNISTIIECFVHQITVFLYVFSIITKKSELKLLFSLVLCKKYKFFEKISKII